jgi:hypothetical protein
MLMLYYLFLALSFYTDAGTCVPLYLGKDDGFLQADNAMKINIAMKIVFIGQNRIPQAEP